ATNPGMEADQPTQVVHSYCAQQPELARQRARVGDALTVCGYERSSFGVLAVSRVTHANDNDLVVGKQVLLDCITECEPVEDRPEPGRVVHRGHLKIGLLGLSPEPTSEIARCRCHEQTTAGRDPHVVKDGRELAGLWAGAAVRLVCDDQIEPA